jgi:hypothetical protein
MNRSIAIIFGDEIPRELPSHDEVITGSKLNALIDPGSIYEATELLEELPKLMLPNGAPITESLMYEGYQLWWIHNSDIFRYFCLPYTQYNRLLEHLRDFSVINLVNPPYESLFRIYLESHGRTVRVVKERKDFAPGLFSVGVLIQLFLTLISLPILAIRKLPILIYTGDKFERGKDYDFRMKSIYEELRRRHLPFSEFIRGIESWQTVVSHAWTRKRAVVYSEAIIPLARLLGQIEGRKTFTLPASTPEQRFRLAIATQYIQTREDVWAIRIMRGILRAIQVRAAFIPAASERSWHTLLGCKLNNIPTVGIMHGAHSRYYNTYDFLTGYKGEKHLGVDKYGVWSEWWKEYYTDNSKVYTPEHLHVSGPMRSLTPNDDEKTELSNGDLIRVLFISEEMAVPQEVLPYLYELLKHKDLKVILKFRPSRDRFEEWLEENNPEMFNREDLEISRENILGAVRNINVAVGCQSTGVIEALFQLKVPIYFRTQKWGDYYNIKSYDKAESFFAETPDDLVKKIRNYKKIPTEDLKNLQEKYFGDPYRNGSKWVVDEIQEVISK